MNSLRMLLRPKNVSLIGYFAFTILANLLFSRVNRRGKSSEKAPSRLLSGRAHVYRSDITLLKEANRDQVLFADFTKKGVNGAYTPNFTRFQNLRTCLSSRRSRRFRD